MKYVIGIDLGTSAVKALLINQAGEMVEEVSKSYPLIQERKGYVEQNPEEWVQKTIEALKELVGKFNGNPIDIEGISFSGQMHGLVLLDENKQVLRNAILWNDTRTADECKRIYEVIGKDRLLEITKNIALEGFTLPKILWVKRNEPHIFKKVKTFVLPKDYLRYRMTGELQMEYSDAAGTLLLDSRNKEWSTEICHLLDIDSSLCPELVDSLTEVGRVGAEFSHATGLLSSTRVFAGGADNACGAIGSGIIENDKILCSIGTSGVILSYEEDAKKNFEGRVHYFNHSVPNAYYAMGVTLSAGYSLTWFKNVFAKNETYEELLADIDSVPIGSNGLLFTPYILGERTPHLDAQVRGSFIGMDSSHQRKEFVRAVLEGITFSLNESIQIFREKGKTIDEIISIGGGAKSDVWLQMQADIFDAKITRLQVNEGPAMGAAMIAAVSCDWFESLKLCADSFLKIDKQYLPDQNNVKKYKQVFSVYQDVYRQTKNIK